LKTFHMVSAVLMLGTAALAAQESAPVEGIHVTARLVSKHSGIVPGKPFTVGLRLDMEKGWHTNADPPGDAGIPTKLSWTLPEGFKAGKIEWPKPEDFTLGPLKTRGYKGTVVLPVTIFAPATLNPGETVRLAAKAEWLACEVACIPGSADLVLDLPVVSGDLPPNPDFPKTLSKSP
jgi:DsbC/DsbD-like thiol-disulfide interchange protein